MRKPFCVALVFCVPLFAQTAAASPACEPFSDEAKDLPLTYLDRADPLAARVTFPLEEDLLTRQIAEPESGSLQKHYCEMGMFTMVVRWVRPVADDSIAAIVTEASYDWDAGQDPAGWVLAQMREHHMCGRGPAPFAPICN